MLREIQDVCPGVLLELGFLYNWEEAEHSGRRESVMGYAMVIVQALMEESEAKDY